MTENHSFITFGKKRGLIFDDSDHELFPLKYYALEAGQEHKFTNPVYVYCVEGYADFYRSRGSVLFRETISGGQYLSEDLTSEILVKTGLVVIVEILYNSPPMFHKGGPLEEDGRLNYIDGCTDSLLIPPIKKGYPCLNHLHFPAKVDQTQHTHPSHRIGVVTKGQGECVTPFGNLPLETGMIFIIKEWDDIKLAEGIDGRTYPAGQHAFRTFDIGMDVLAFHPDSDFGPEDEAHPMINRTIVDGVPAAKHKNYEKFRT